ncbi:MAG TPA: hypothetical protein VNF93_02415 [Buchnera sp. (in: enterobacteria)]|nr:hypothetical protein [Buchnera sp. (in: enterobacteria)]
MKKNTEVISEPSTFKIIQEIKYKCREHGIVYSYIPLKFQSEELKYNVKFCSICYAEFLQTNCYILEEIKEYI